MRRIIINYLLFLIIILSMTSCSITKKVVDNNSNHIQAHGGGIIKIRDKWYWFGEYRGEDIDLGYRYVGCYSSTNLSNWKFLNKIKFAVPDAFEDGWVLERPKAFYDEKAKKYVMYMHLDD